MNPDDLEWMDAAACKGMADEGDGYGKFFYDETGFNRAEVNDGKFVCAHCPVAVDCLRYAETLMCEYGTFGGLDQNERRDLWENFGSVDSPAGRERHRQMILNLKVKAMQPRPYRRKKKVLECV